MCNFPESRSVGAAALAAALLLTATVAAQEPAKRTGYYGYGEPATAEQIAGWDIDVRPDGKGLPPGEGSVEDGEYLYEAQCALCHGSFGESVAGYPALAGGGGSLTDPRPKKTVGSYWGHTSTLWDYIHRAMPFTQPESLTDDEVYAVTAYVLYLNDLVDYDFVLSRDNLTEVVLPNAGNFIPEQRPDTRNERCMTRCKDPSTVAVASEAPAYVPDDAPADNDTAGLAAAAPGAGVYEKHCALCHTAGVGGAPVVGDSQAWAPRVESGMETLYRHALEGFQGESGVMPPRGGFVTLADDDVRSAVDYIVEQSQ